MHYTIGPAVVAKVDSGEKIIRHSECEILVAAGERKRCEKCEGHRKSLLVMVKRLEHLNTSTSPTSHANYRYLTSPLLAERCKKLHKNCVASERKLTNMRERIERLSASHGIAITEDLEQDMKEIIKDNTAKIATTFKVDTFERMFWEQHSKAYGCKDARGMRWHPAMIKWCLYLRHLSGKAYEMLRNTGILKLPSQRTLRDYTHYIPATVGFSADVDEMLMATMKVRIMCCTVM